MAGEPVNGPPADAKKRGISNWLIGLVAVALVALILYGFWERPSLEGATMPSLTLPLYGGGQVALSELRGQPVVLNFWASWCAPCRAEAPTLEKVYGEYRERGVTFLGVGVRDVMERGQAFIDEFGITYPNAHDPQGQAWRAFRLTGVPETLFVTSDGVVAGRHIGHISEEKLREAVESLLAPGPAGGE